MLKFDYKCYLEEKLATIEQFLCDLDDPPTKYTVDLIKRYVNKISQILFEKLTTDNNVKFNNEEFKKFFQYWVDWILYKTRDLIISNIPKTYWMSFFNKLINSIYEISQNSVIFSTSLKISNKEIIDKLWFDFIESLLDKKSIDLKTAKYAKIISTYDELIPIIKFNNNGEKIEELFYRDTAKKSLKKQTLYNPDGSYIKKHIFLEPQGVNEWLSAIENFDNQDKCLQSRYYLDNKFQKLDTIKKTEYSDNGTCTTISSNSRCYSKSCWDIEKVLMHWEKTYTDSDFSNVETSKQLTFNENNTVTLIAKDYRQNIYVEILLDYNKIISNNSITDRFFSALTNCQNMIYRKYYYDSDLHKLKELDNFVHNEDGSYIMLTQYKYLFQGIAYSTKTTVDSSGEKCLKEEFFYDENFEKIAYSANIVHNSDGSYQKLSIYTEQQPYGAFVVKENYNKFEQIINSKSYLDKSLETLIQTIDYFYDNNGNYQRNINFYIENQYPFAIEKYNFAGQILSATAYKDRDGKSVLRKSKFTYNNDGSIRAERYYPNSKEDWNFEMQEIAPDLTIISSKKTKCNFIKKLLFYSTLILAE